MWPSIGAAFPQYYNRPIGGPERAMKSSCRSYGGLHVINLLRQSKIGLVPLNWRYDSAKKQEYLSGIASYGFKGIQISGDQAQSADFLHEMNLYDIAPAEQYLAIRCGEKGPLEGSEAQSATTIAQAIAAKVEMIVFAVDGTKDRDRCAGRADTGPQMSADGFARLAQHVEHFAQSAASEGIRSSFHPHAATYIETERETRLLMDKVDSELVGLCLDVGHWIVAGADPIKAVSDYGHRITHVHVKDVSEDVLTKMLSSEITSMSTAVEDFKLFVPAGTGLLKLQDFFTALEKYSYRGWLMSEQDSAWAPSEAASGISIGNMRAALS
jgi:inosose dehydratase